ncbi:MAG TPA: type II toxin-antitoxin system RelE/ParE family toxin [Polyangiaceae bacterium]|nr:type II toxin-antitoxin system RelE/ParE family toxin [Polyangiaceae bacterium]
MGYSIDFTPSAAKELAKLPKAERRRIATKIDALANEPRPPGVEKLAGEDAWRVRVGDYRIVYEVQDRVLVILVLAVGHRREIYKRLKA